MAMRDCGLKCNLRAGSHAIRQRSQFQHANVAVFAVCEDGIVAGGEYESVGACGCDQVSVRWVCVRLPGKESALGCRICIERQQADARGSQCTLNPIAKRGGKLNYAFRVQDADFPDRNGRYQQSVFPAGLVQLLHTDLGQAIGIALRIPKPDMGIEKQRAHFLRDRWLGRLVYR